MFFSVTDRIARKSSSKLNDRFQASQLDGSKLKRKTHNMADGLNGREISDSETDVNNCRSTCDQENHDGFTPLRINPTNSLSENDIALSGSTSQREDNPFSFRHFLQRSQNSNSLQNADVQRINEDSEAQRFGGARPKIKTPLRQPPENDLKSPCGLPDFVQDHLVVEQELNSSIPINGFYHVNHNHGIPIATEYPLDLPRSHSPIHAEGAMPIPLDLANIASLNIDSNQDLATLDLANLNASGGIRNSRSEEEHSNNLSQVHEINNNEGINNLSLLPDFLSDGPMHSGRINHESNENPEQEPSVFENSLAEENARLRQQLETALENEQLAQSRIQRLESLLEDHCRREREEAKTLEQATELVENNLKLATERALHAESQVADLKREIRRLQEENSSLHEIIRLHHSNSSPVRHRSLNQTAEDLNDAANRAERSVRELLLGVEQLRVIAASLENLDRIEEVKSARKEK